MPELVLTIGDREFFAYADAHEHAIFHLVDAAKDIADKVRDTAREFAPKRTGRLALEGVDAEVEMVTSTSVRVVAGLRDRPEYGIFVHEGTGIYGDFHRPIFAHRGNVFAFDVNGKPKFSRSNLGQMPHPFVREAVLIVEDTYVPARVALLAEQVT